MRAGHKDWIMVTIQRHWPSIETGVGPRGFDFDGVPG